MVAAVEQRFGPINRLPATIEWLTDNGSCYIAGETRKFAREIGFEPLTTPVEMTCPRSFIQRRVVVDALLPVNWIVFR
jgi:transposase InsO family protein